MKRFNANDYEDIYKALGIDLRELGCIMLDLKAIGIPDFPAKGSLYYTKDPKKFWIDGFVASKTPHVTLLYGLLKSGQEWKKYVNDVLDGWECKTVKIEEIGFFDSPYKDEPYYCIVAHLELSDNLLEGHYRLSLLPHINTFPVYNAHFTLAYIKKDEAIKNIILDFFNKNLAGKEIFVKSLNFGN